MLSSQTLKSEAIAHDAVECCINLLNDLDARVRSEAAKVIGRMALLRNGESAIIAGDLVAGLTETLSDSTPAVRQK
jgi:hypothetical protein